MAGRLTQRNAAATWLSATFVVAAVVLTGAVVTFVERVGDGEGPMRALLVTVALGLVFGPGYVTLQLLLDAGPHTPDALEQRFGVPVIGVAPPSDRFVRQTEPDVSFRSLHDNLAARCGGEFPGVVVVTSPERRDGRSTVAANLALAAALAGRRVVLVDADLSRPTLAGRFGLAEGAGLSHILSRRAVLDELLQPTTTEGLEVLAGGAAVSDPGALLGSADLARLVGGLAQHAVAIVDAPPVLPARASGLRTGAVELAATAEAILVVVPARDTRDRQLDDALRRLNTHDGRLFLVVNRVGPASSAYCPGL